MNGNVLPAKETNTMVAAKNLLPSKSTCQHRIVHANTSHHTHTHACTRDAVSR